MESGGGKKDKNVRGTCNLSTLHATRYFFPHSFSFSYFRIVTLTGITFSSLSWSLGTTSCHWDKMLPSRQESNFEGKKERTVQIFDGFSRRWGEERELWLNTVCRFPFYLVFGSTSFFFSREKPSTKSKFSRHIIPHSVPPSGTLCFSVWLEV